MRTVSERGVFEKVIVVHLAKQVAVFKRIFVRGVDREMMIV